MCHWWITPLLKKHYVIQNIFMKILYKIDLYMYAHILTQMIGL